MRYEPVTGDFRPVVDIFFSEGDKEVMDLFDRLVVRYEELARKNKVTESARAHSYIFKLVKGIDNLSILAVNVLGLIFGC